MGSIEAGPQRELFLADEAETVRCGAQLARAVSGGAIFFLLGELGVGKTTFTRGVLLGCGHRGAVKSPTYTLVEPYETPAGVVYHFDLYRLGDPEELEYLGIRDYFDSDALCLIEWPQRGEPLLPLADLEIGLTLEGSGRRLRLRSHTQKGATMADTLWKIRNSDTG
jgi:tRNA threonylcarbamoyladenosine biosynthesis protein TsaE